MPRLSALSCGPSRREGAWTTLWPQLRCIDRLPQHPDNHAKVPGESALPERPGARKSPMAKGTTRRFAGRGALGALCAAALVGLLSGDVRAQGWGWWPWSQPEPRQAPREPYRPPLDQLPPGQMPPCQYPQGQPPPGAGPGGYGQGYGQQRSSICLQLERRLVTETQGSGQSRDLLPRIENDMRQLERNLQIGKQQLERADCWDQFLFSRTLRRTPRCVQLAGEVDANRQRLADLEAQRRQIMGTRDRSFQDDIIRELA